MEDDYPLRAGGLFLLRSMGDLIMRCQKGRGLGLAFLRMAAARQNIDTMAGHAWPVPNDTSRHYPHLLISLAGFPILRAYLL